MLQKERHERILARLKKHNTVKVAALAKEMGISESTIRRDLLALSQLGKINKVHGGATVLGQEFLHNEEDFNKKSLMLLKKKLMPKIDLLIEM